MSYRLLATTCYDGDCPTLWIDDADMVKIRGTDPDDPTTERDIEMPGAAWRQLLAQLSL